MNTIFQEENYNKGNEGYNNKNKAKPIISDIETIKLSLKMLSINQNKSNKNDNNNNKFEIPSLSSQYNYFDSSDNEDDKTTQKTTRNSGTTKKESYNKNMRKNGYKDYSNNPYTVNTSYPLTESSNYNPNDYYNMMNTQQYNSPKKFNNYNYFKGSNDLSSSTFDNYTTSLHHQSMNTQNQSCKYNNQSDGTTPLNFNNFNKNQNIIKCGNNSKNNNSNNNNNNSLSSLYDSDFQVTPSNDYKNQKTNYKKKNEQGQTISNKKYLNINRTNEDHLNNLNFNARKDNTSKALLFADNNASRIGLDTFNKNDFKEKTEYPLTYNNNNTNLFFANNYLTSKFSFNTSLNNILNNNSLNIYNGESEIALTNHSLDPSSSSLLFYSNNAFDKDNTLINSLNYPSTNMSTTTIQFPTRPGYGKNGKLISIKANFYPILSLPRFDIYHYEVTVEPETTSIKLQKIYQKWEEENQNTSLKNLNLIFDGKKNIYTSK